MNKAVKALGIFALAIVLFLGAVIVGRASAPDNSAATGAATTTATADTTTSGATASNKQNTDNGACEARNPQNVTEDIKTISRADSSEGQALPDLAVPNPNRALAFPDVPQSGNPALVEYGHPWEDGDFFEDCFGDFDVSQFHFRVITAGVIDVPQLNVSCQSTDTKGCALVVINWFGETVMYRNTRSDNGFTLAGRVWDMGSPQKAQTAAQALLDHYIGRMTASPDGANCGIIDACNSVEWHVVIVGDNGSDGTHEIQAHWSGLY